MSDFDIHIDGSMAVVTPNSHEATRWMEENVEAKSWQWLGPSLAIDLRFLDMILDAITYEGLTVDND